MDLSTTPRRAGLALSLAALLLTGATGPAGAGESADPGLAVTAFALGSTPDRVIDRDADKLTTVGVAAVSLSADGRRVAAPTADVRRVLRRAHQRGLRAELLLSNWSNRLEAFDPRAASRLLRSDAKIDRVAARLTGLVVDQGWDGVSVDLEGLGRQESSGLVALVRELQTRMPAGRTVSVCVSARTSTRAYRSGGYRMAPLAAAADTITLMTYDEHGPTWSGPGPIGSLSWQRRALAAAVALAPRTKIDLGIAGYGYTWPDRRMGHGTGRTVTPTAARRLVRHDGARARWRAKAGEWTARLSDGTRLWWSDARSYRVRTRLAEEQGLHGVAVWRLGSADPL
ncbi:glycosyl hydrolase family 18 protein [Nocardioides pacificus]